MGYRISYDQTGEAKRTAIWVIRLKYLLIFALLVLLGIWISGMDLSVTVGAMEEMAGMFRDGGDFVDAFSAFCSHVLQGA